MRRFLIGAAWLLIAVLSVRAQSLDELSGRFSIRSNGEQVVFSRGNLCLAIENSTWYFATNQYDIIGEANIFGGALSTPIDLFGYSGSTYYNWGVSPVNANSLFSGDFIDWGENAIGQSPAGYWRTLTTYEWNYLLNQRDNASQLRGVATVSGQKGLVLLPDVATAVLQDSYSAAEWAQLEQEGAVFLPFAGRRIRANRVDSIGTRGYYWTATPFAGDYVGLVNLGQSSISMDQSDRFYGHSVRLIHSIGIQRDSVYAINIGQDCSFSNPVNTKADACTLTLGVDGCSAQYSNTFAYRDVVNLTAVATDCGEFVAWSDGETANPRSIQLTGSLSLRAIFKIKRFEVQFRNTDGSIVATDSVLCGETPAVPATNPTRAATAQYTYSFAGWTPELAALTADQIYTAMYDSVLNRYRVDYVDYDGTPLAFDSLYYGATPAFAGDTPTRTATEAYEYTFRGWTPEYAAVTGNQTYTAQYDSLSLAVHVQFKDYDGSLLDSMTIYSGQTPAYTGTEPTRAATAQYTYIFVGWTPELAALTVDQIYTATYDSVLNRYRVDYVDYDGTPLAFDSLYYGDTPAFAGDTPTRTATKAYEYTFRGWTPEYAAVTGNQTYTAQYDSLSLLYTIRFVDYNDTLLYSTSLSYGETPSAPALTLTRAATAQYTYSFAGWTPAFYTVTEEQTYTATYDSVLNRYRVDYVDYDGTPLSFDSLYYGETAAFTGTDPIRQATAEYTYTFVGWTPAYAPVSGNQTYTAVYDSVLNRYLIDFVDYDGTPLAADSVAYGMRPSYGAPSQPERAATAEYTYSFAGWTPSFMPVTADQTYTAVYDSVLNRYAVRYYDYDGTLLQTDSLDYGLTPAYTGTEPARQATAQYTYTFAGWTPAYAAVVADQDYTARYDSLLNRYEVIFCDYDATALQTDTLNYGMMPVYRGLTPTRAATAEYTYIFTAWTPELTAVSEQAVYTAQYDSVLNRYAVSYYDYDGAWIQTDTLNYGTTPDYQGLNPARTATAQYTYTFAGWTPAFATVITDQAYTAIYDSVLNRYQIDFVDYDGTMLQTDSLDYGLTPAFTGSEPARQATDAYTYVFNGWLPAVVPVSGNAVYTASFDSIVNRYRIDFVDYDGTLLYTDSVAYNLLPSYGAATQPTRAASAQYSYTFTGWTPALTAVTADAQYTAAYDSTVNRYRVTYQNYNGMLLQADSLYYGDMPAYTGSTPTRSATAQYTYIFRGWTPAYETIAADQTYTATYDSVLNRYEVRFVNYDNAVLQIDTLGYGLLPAYSGPTPIRPSTDSYRYTFRRWTPAIASVTGNAVYTAVYDSTAMLYTVRFLNYDSTVLYSTQLTYGTLPVYRGNTPTRPATDEFRYVFSGWFPALTEVTGDADYLATYAGVRIEYKVEFRDYNGALLLTDSVAYGTTPVYTGVLPTRTANVQYSYTFAGWAPEPTSVTGDAVYTAVYDSVLNRYTITFLNYDLTVLQSTDVAYGTLPHYTAADPVKTATQAYSYTFTGWTPEVVAVTEPATYTAVFDSVVNTYTVTLLGDNATLRGAGTYEYGTRISVEALPDEGYHFVEWSDGDWHNPREVEVLADLTLTATIEIDCIGLNSVPVARIYDWLLLLNVTGLEEMGYTVTEDDVTWFRAIGEIDDPEHRDNDELVGRGFYLKVGEAYVGNGRFYAVVDVSANSSSKDNLCTGYIRSDVVGVGLTDLDDVTGDSWAPYLYPAAVRPSQTVTIQGLLPHANTHILVYDLAGHIIEEAVAERGEREYRLVAPTVSGTYLVELRTDNQQIVLRYIVLHP
ncbi:MAG: hypothetical protein IJU36_05360 [Paludibacteraceae bacterium]|nr:hypothetical protein [Paludibacteraceae bacterium]